mmetsp:Transcript_22662/g.68212  ORF Transcript_22662/g.68212 Transcript_22662/m.68212 type:complete len:295 (+) Transcript_22662:1478-2362(+)
MYSTMSRWSAGRSCFFLTCSNWKARSYENAPYSPQIASESSKNAAMMARTIEKIEGCRLRCSSGKRSADTLVLPPNDTSSAAVHSSRVSTASTPARAARIAGTNTLPRAFRAATANRDALAVTTTGGLMKPRSHMVYLPGYSYDEVMSNPRCVSRASTRASTAACPSTGTCVRVTVTPPGVLYVASTLTIAGAAGAAAARGLGATSSVARTYASRTSSALPESIASATRAAAAFRSGAASPTYSPAAAFIMMKSRTAPGLPESASRNQPTRSSAVPPETSASGCGVRPKSAGEI